MDGRAESAPKDARLLYDIVRALRPDCVIDTGVAAHSTLPREIQRGIGRRNDLILGDVKEVLHFSAAATANGYYLS
jgi:hypothetical protein